MALIYKSPNNWSCSVLRDCICPCLLSWVLRVAEMSLFFRPEQGKHEETRREFVTLLKKKKELEVGGEVGESPIICCQVSTDLDIFF